MRLIEFIIPAGTSIFEGGNIFKDADKQPMTKRIEKADVDPTLKWMERLFKKYGVEIDLRNNKLGSTGLTPTSGDLDIAVDEADYTKEQLIDALTKFTTQKGLEPKEWIRKSGVNVHFKTPIRGDYPRYGFVQLDLMFGADSDWQKFAMQGAANSEFKGSHRHILMSSIAKSLGLKWSSKEGVTSRESGKVISKDPEGIAKLLLGPEGEAGDFRSVEAMIERIQDLPEYGAMVADARETFARYGLELPA